MPPRIGLIIASARAVRICPQVADFVLGTIKGSSSGANEIPIINKIDLKEWSLPLFDEPVIPAQIKDPSGYKHEHTRAWSREISSHDAFIFVSPQYNWGYPASLKNALDYLFNEWTGKPAMIITYGGHGGDKCSAQLNEVLTGMKLQPISNRVQMKYPNMEFGVKKCFPGEELGLDATSDESVWAQERPNIVAAFEELSAALSKQTFQANGEAN